MNDEVKKAFSSGPMVSILGVRKLSSYLVRAKLYPLERSVGSFKCNGKRCQVCINVTESNTFSSSVDKKEYVINHSFNCNDKCIIYLLTYNKCKIQYVGKTVDDVFDGIITKIIIRNTLGKNHVCNNTYLNTSQARVTIVFWMTSPLSLLIRILKILTNGNTTGDIPLKQWHLKG